MDEDTQTDQEASETHREEATSADRNGSDSASLLSDLRERRRKIAETRTLDLDLPGYNGRLVIRYKRISWDEQKKLGLKLQRSNHPRKELLAQADYLIAATDQILVREDPDEPLSMTPLNLMVEEFGDEPVRWDDRLAKALDIPTEQAGSARNVLLAAFSNDTAVTYQHNAVGQWMGESNSEEDEGF